MMRRRRINPYNGIKYFKETAPGVPISMPTGQGNLSIKLACSLEDVSNVAAYTATPTLSAMKSLFGRYCITGVKYVFIPTYTSSDSTGRAADRVVYAVNRDPNSPAPNEAQLIRQNDAKFTNTSRKFTIYVKHPEPVLYSTAGQAGSTPSQMPPPTGGGAGATNQVSATPVKKQWTWLPTRYGYDPVSGRTSQAPDHVGADVHITSNNTSPPNPEAPGYVVYTMFKTVYFAFKEQD